MLIALIGEGAFQSPIEGPPHFPRESQWQFQRISIIDCNPNRSPRRPQKSKAWLRFPACILNIFITEFRYSKFSSRRQCVYDAVSTVRRLKNIIINGWLVADVLKIRPLYFSLKRIIRQFQMRYLLSQLCSRYICRKDASLCWQN